MNKAVFTINGADIIAGICLIIFVILKCKGIDHVTDMIAISVLSFYFGGRSLKKEKVS